MTLLPEMAVLLCRQKTTLFIGLPSDKRRRHHRDAARETWMQMAAKTNEVCIIFTGITYLNAGMGALAQRPTRGCCNRKVPDLSIMAR